MIFLWYHREELDDSLNNLYRAVGLSKQAVHQMLHRHLIYQEELEYLKVIILQIRDNHPTMGLQALYWKIRPEKMGRDRFLSFCKRYGFQLTPLKKPRARTTDSRGVHRFENLVEDLKVERADQVWVSDITYYEIGGKFYYITFIMDVHSRYIIGCSVSGRLFTEQTTLAALKKAIAVCMKKYGEIPKGIIFHSDGGGQYFDKNFVKLTASYHILNSMCVYSHENPFAERLNRTIKECYLNPRTITDLGDLTRQVDRAVYLYNTDRPHKSLKYDTPADYYYQKADYLKALQ